MQDIQHDPIAIIGIGCRFPGADNPQAFWELLRAGRSAIREVPADRWKMDDIYDPEPAQPGKTVSRWGGFLNQVDQFDWRAFRIPPHEVKQMDPQHRLLLEVAWEALEDAGLPFEQVAGSNTSVSMGISWNDYFRLLTGNQSQLDMYTAVGNAMCFAANRLSYAFDLKGPSSSVDAGCTSSLMSVYQACQSLWHGEADLALAGGVNLLLSPDLTIMLSQADFLSHDGQCKTLDERADGFVRGEGAGVVVLKPLSQVKSSDRVYALIRGIAANHNGHNEWIVASSRQAQEALLHAAYAKAGLDPAEIDYVELNGTAFLQGDAIEAQALGMVLGSNERRVRPCSIGSVKTNIGHLEAAAGIASLIKVALSLYHQQIPPTLNLHTPNPNVSWQSLGVTAQQELTPWPEKEGTPAAGINALSMSGANIHAVLSASPTPASAPAHGQADCLLPISARSEEALIAQVTSLRDFLLSAGSAHHFCWPDICYTASVRRTHHAYRLAITSSSAQEAASILDAHLQKPLPRRSVARKKLIFLCTQQSESAQSVMEDPFLLANPAYQATVNACDRVVQQLTRQTLSEMKQRGNMGEILYFTHQVALADLWRSWNILPAAILGEGLGELAAAYLAGALTLEDALSLLLAAREQATSLVSRVPIHRLSPASPCLFYATMPSLEENADLWEWTKHLSNSLVSDAQIDRLLVDNYELFLDLGQPSALMKRISSCLQEKQRAATFLSSFLDERGAASTLLEALGSFYMQGYAVAWSALYTEEHTCVSLPPYQWQRERFWPGWLEHEEMSSSPEKQQSKELAGPGEPEKKLYTLGTADTVHHTGTELEAQIQNVWRELLGIEQIQLHDNFFALGGSSLLLSQLSSRLNRIFQVKLSATTIFEHPTIVELAEIIRQSNVSTSAEPDQSFEKQGQQYDEQLLAMIEHLTDEEIAALAGRRETFARLLQAKIRSQKIFPLSFAQRRLWFLNQLQHGSPVYHVLVTYRITGELDSKALEMSLHEIVARHETLRTTFPALDGQPMQIIAPRFSLEIAREDIAQVPTEQQAAEILRQATHELKKPFDLAEGPLLRARLLRLSASEHILFLNVHHIIFDGWSMRIFSQELAALYSAFSQGRPSPLPELPIQYLDYTLWERKWLQGEALETGLAYWEQQLRGAPPALQLPIDHPRPPLETFRGAFREFMLPASLLSELKKIGQREKVTLFMLLLAAFQMLLAYYSQQDDIVVGTDAANRGQMEVENLIGFFVNQLVLRTDLSGDPSLSELLQRVRQVVLGAYEHQHVPFDQLVRALNPVRLPDRAPIFQAKLVLQNVPVLPESSAVTIEPLLVDAGAAQLDLVLDLTETAAGLRTIWQYNTDLFEASSIERMHRHFSALLQALLTSPSSTLSSFYAILDEIEGQQSQARRYRLAGDSTRHEQYTLHDGNLARALEEQVARTPHNIALVMQDRSMTYAELNAQANKLAHQLKKLGVSQEKMVVLCTERSLEAIVGFFGIFKAGGVCVSLDPAYPKERWTFILQDCQASLAVTQSTFACTFSEYGLTPVNVDELDLVHEDENPATEIAPEQLAYVMYTSGSTGQPKGVAVSHQAAFNHCMVMRNEFCLDERDRILQFYSLAFDGSLEQFFPGLFCGATIVMRGTTSWSVAELNKAVREQKLTVVNLTPALWQEWSQELLAEPETMRDVQLRLVIIGAEAMTPEALQHWQKTPLATRHLINAYGPTEAVITAITFDVPEQFCPEDGSYSVPIGRPLPQREIYLLNRQGQPVSPGASGEIYLGGPLLARGYLNRPDLTAERFIPNPFSTLPGSRLYRTGDLARYLRGGMLEYLGRADQQVKIRGFRIELGEIESVLLQHPEVRTAIVVAREDKPGEKRLVAYVVLQQNFSVTVPELRGFLVERLPAYMIPSAYLCLDTVPLTANGKIDHRALPAPEDFRPVVEEIFVAPRNPTEEAVAKIWREVLALEQVGIHDNFFLLGGHSLIAIQVIARVRAAFQVDIPVHMLFLAPTVAQFAAKIGEAQGMQRELALPAITRRRRGSGVENGSHTMS